MSDLQQPSQNQEQPAQPQTTRRRFLRSGAAALTAGAAASATLGGMTPNAPAATGVVPSLVAAGAAFRRANLAFRTRVDAARLQYARTAKAQTPNGDERRYAKRIGNFSKTLPHDATFCEVNDAAYNALLRAVTSGKATDFAAIPKGGTGKLVNPQAAFALTLEGSDSQSHVLPPAPEFASAWEAAEMAEVYWRALTRDVPFAHYGTDVTVGAAITDLSRFSDFRGPRVNGAITPGSLFRSSLPGDLTGPYVSQFMLLDVPYGPTSFSPRVVTPTAGRDFMTSVATCKAIQRGEAPTESVTFEAERRYVYNGRTLAECVHTDFSYQFFLNAALILLSYGSNALDPSNPYVTSTNQAGFVTFGGPSILEAVAKAATLALKAAWYQKWCVHRRVRPEMFGLRTHQRVTGTGSATNAYPIHGELLNSDALPALFSKNGTYLLPMSYREGCPAHPAYPGGHATIAAACVTVLKAFFNESFVIPNPVEASETGLSLVPYTGGALTVGNELNKLASNAGLGRDTAGVHWRSDEVEAFKLGEAVGISLLADLSFCTTEPHTGFRLTKFDGTVLEIG